MPGSVGVFDDVVKKMIELCNPDMVLDIGPGGGKYGRMLQAIEAERNRPIRKTCVEVDNEKVIQRFDLQSIYDEIINEDAAKLAKGYPKLTGDVVIAGDVILRLTKSEGVDLIEYLQRRFKYIFLVIPVGFVGFEDEDTPHEPHIAIWWPEDIDRFNGAYWVQRELDGINYLLASINSITLPPQDYFVVRDNMPVTDRPLSSEEGIEFGFLNREQMPTNRWWVTSEVPILMYHRVATDGPVALAPWRIAPEAFERQLAWLQRNGFHSISLDDYFNLWFTRNIRNIPGKPIVLTFDDAYADFYHTAWPLLRRYGFGATVFVPTDYVGGTSDWDKAYGSPAQIMSWDQLVELKNSSRDSGGIRFGSHSCSHKKATELSEPEMLEDAINSRKILESRLGLPVSGYCYPYACADSNSRRIVEQAGYKFAVGGLGDRDDAFYIPRIEISGSDTIEDFISKLPKPQVITRAC
jgi:peptidoglycan/xylan/chitin deacetylase (PgdA/CDA1 family)